MESVAYKDSYHKGIAYVDSLIDEILEHFDSTFNIPPVGELLLLSLSCRKNQDSASPRIEVSLNFAPPLSADLGRQVRSIANPNIRFLLDQIDPLGHVRHPYTLTILLSDRDDELFSLKQRARRLTVYSFFKTPSNARFSSSSLRGLV